MKNQTENKLNLKLKNQNEPIKNLFISQAILRGYEKACYRFFLAYIA